MNEQNNRNFEPPVMTVLTSHEFNQDINTASVTYNWSILEIPDLNE